MSDVYRILGFFFAIFAAYYSYDTLRSAFTGTYPRGSSSRGDPRAFKVRLNRAIGGVVAGALALAALIASVLGVPPWP